MLEQTAVCEICGGACAPAADKDGYALWRCRRCGFLFVHPYPTAAELAAYYGAGYRAASADFYPKAASRIRRSRVRALRFVKHAHWRKRVIDLGCGGGFMADAFRRCGADAHGLDISENSIAYARRRFPKCTFFRETFAAFGARGLTFDFIFSSELMEHIAGTAEVMALIVALSRPGTVVYVATPDAGHPAVPANLLEWPDICPPEHLQWFDRRNMTLLFEKHGFAPLKTYAKKSPALSMLFVRQG